MRILIVCDSADSTDSLLKLLRQMGHEETWIARSAETALQKAIEFAVDVVFMDIELPEMSGYDAALLMHQHPQLERTRLMALTAYREHSARDRARTSGFERYIVQPVTAEALQEILV